MTDLTWQFCDAPRAQELEQVTQAVILHDRQALGLGMPVPVACALRDGQVLVGGVSGHIEAQRLYVNFLWVEESRRGQGLGQRILAHLEQRAGAMGCREFQIEALSERTAALYGRLGYRPIATVDDDVPGLSLRVLRKQAATGA